MKDKIKINDVVEFKASSLGTGTIVSVPNEDTHMYTVRLGIQDINGKTISCTEHYFRVVE
tara:strand:- start:2349 stop:2528 length:180 start_codon:yes stop_codon:yes gene_type:complete